MQILREKKDEFRLWLVIRKEKTEPEPEGVQSHEALSHHFV